MNLNSQVYKTLPKLRILSVYLLSTLIVALCLVPALSHAAAPVFSAILGGSGQDYASAVTTDNQGNTYVAGLTYSPDFRATPGAYQTKHAGVVDAFVAKFSRAARFCGPPYLAVAATIGPPASRSIPAAT